MLAYLKLENVGWCRTKGGTAYIFRPVIISFEGLADPLMEAVILPLHNWFPPSSSANILG